MIEGKEYVSINDNKAIGNFVHIWGYGGVEIGKTVLIAANCCVTSIGHNTTMMDMKYNIISKDYFEDDGWIGSIDVINSGIKIGSAAFLLVISANTKDISSNDIVLGVTERILKTKPFHETNEKNFSKKFIV